MMTEPKIEKGWVRQLHSGRYLAYTGDGACTDDPNEAYWFSGATHGGLPAIRVTLPGAERVVQLDEPEDGCEWAVRARRSLNKPWRGREGVSSSAPILMTFEEAVRVAGRHMGRYLVPFRRETTDPETHTLVLDPWAGAGSALEELAETVTEDQLRDVILALSCDEDR